MAISSLSGGINSNNWLMEPDDQTYLKPQPLEQGDPNAGVNNTPPHTAYAPKPGASLAGLQTLIPGGGAGQASAGSIVTYPDTTAGKDAAYARAKDQTGLNARASLNALQDQLGGNQMLGSGLAADQSRQIIEHGQGQLDEVSRAQAINDANSVEKRAATEYQGRIQQRGQDISVAQSNAARQQQVLESLFATFGNGILY